MRFTAFAASTCLYFTAIHFPKFPSFIQQHRCRSCLLHSRITHSREIHSWILQHINPTLPPTLRLFYNILKNLQLPHPHPLPTSSAYIINHPHPSSIHCSNIFHNHTNQLLHLKDQSSTHSQAHQGIASNWYLFSFHTCTQIPSTSIFSTHFKHI